jgi:hypothetical protein
MEEEINYVKSILPSHYQVKESKSKDSIHCSSTIGIKEGVDGEDDEHWFYILSAIRQKFKERFLEVDHNTCFCHVDFTIYLKK